MKMIKQPNPLIEKEGSKSEYSGSYVSILALSQKIANQKIPSVSAQFYQKIYPLTLICSIPIQMLITTFIKLNVVSFVFAVAVNLG
jgi:hypothetical protein